MFYVRQINYRFKLIIINKLIEPVDKALIA